MLYAMNRNEASELNHMPYIAYFAPIVHGENYAGANMVADWYKRNLRIFTNLTRTAAPDDRVFVVFGQGHIKTLRDFVIQHPDFCVVDPLPFLR